MRMYAPVSGSSSMMWKLLTYACTHLCSHTYQWDLRNGQSIMRACKAWTKHEDPPPHTPPHLADGQLGYSAVWHCHSSIEP